MTRKPMKIEDYLFVMARNEGLYPMYDELPDNQKVMLANLNICTGTAESFFDKDGNLFAVGGIRYVGLGEAWLMSTPERRTPTLFRQTAKNFQKIVHDKNLWRVFAETHVSENFLKHLKFAKQDNMFIWTRL